MNSNSTASKVGYIVGQLLVRILEIVAIAGVLYAGIILNSEFTQYVIVSIITMMVGGTSFFVINNSEKTIAYCSNRKSMLTNSEIMYNTIFNSLVAFTFYQYDWMYCVAAMIVYIILSWLLVMKMRALQRK